MKLHILGSSSSGNCYVLESDAEALIIEAGLRMQSVKRALGWQIRKVAGAVITHEHNDHAGHVREMAASGVWVLAPREVFEAHGLSGRPFTRPIVPNKGYRVGGFKVLAVPVKHDVPCLGYIISHPDMGKLLFLTDTVTLDVLVPGLNHIMIEANYADDIVAGNIRSGKMPASLRPRLLASHMEIGQTKAILAENDLSHVDNVVLIHLSDGNADEARFVREVKELTGKAVCAARAGMTLDLSKTPY